MMLRVDTSIKDAGELAAEHDHRSFTSLVEVLIIKHCKTINIDPFLPPDKPE
jgi:hypothetical protein